MVILAANRPIAFVDILMTIFQRGWLFQDEEANKPKGEQARGANHLRCGGESARGWNCKKPGTYVQYHIILSITTLIDASISQHKQLLPMLLAASVN